MDNGFILRLTTQGAVEMHKLTILDHADLRNDDVPGDPFHHDQVSQLPPELRSYAPDPSSDHPGIYRRELNAEEMAGDSVMVFADDELSLVAPVREQVFFYNGSIDRHQKSVAVKNKLYFHHNGQRVTQSKARRRDLALDIGNWVAGVILLAFLGAVVAYGFLGVNVLELVGVL